MKLLPKAITTQTKIALAVIAFFAFLLSLIGGKYFIFVFLIIMSGPFFLIVDYFDMFRKGSQTIDIQSFTMAVLIPLAIGIVNLLMILSHSYRPNAWTNILTIIGCFTWFLLGVSVAFIGV